MSGEPLAIPLVGVVPAAGTATRLGRAPLSKELLPLAYRRGEDGGLRTLTPCDRVLSGMAAAGIRRAVVVVREGKWDLPAWLIDGAEVGLDIAWRVVRATASVPETLAAAAPFVAGCRVALGFPDILLHPSDAFAPVAERLAATGADLALGLFPTDRPDKSDMVELDAGGRPRRLWIKTGRADLRYMWGVAVWAPSFTELLCRRVEQQRTAPEAAAGQAAELWVGDLFQQAIDGGMRVEAVPFPDGWLLDVGTAEDLQRAVERLRNQEP
ncbi:MAG TPA: dTDP-glucose pyrophosphorylase [Thermoanaerobaculia bacterium]|nr:dTDP-glucose pyrophosphorylase [Thermoanaerobaculia bacterium]